MSVGKPVELRLVDARARAAEMRLRLQTVTRFVGRARERCDRKSWPPAASMLVDETLEELAVVEEELRVQVEELVASRAATEDAQQRYLDLFESGPDAYFVTDKHAFVQEANGAAAYLLNVEPYFLRGKPLIHFVVRGNTRIFRGLLADLERESFVDCREIVLRPRHGPPVFRAVLHARVLRKPDGSVAVRWIVRRATDGGGPADDPGPTDLGAVESGGHAGLGAEGRGERSAVRATLHLVPPIPPIPVEQGVAPGTRSQQRAGREHDRAGREQDREGRERDRVVRETDDLNRAASSEHRGALWDWSLAATRPR